MSSALSFQWHLCDVFKVTYLISFDTIVLSAPLALFAQHPGLVLNGEMEAHSQLLFIIHSLCMRDQMIYTDFNSLIWW